MSKTTLKPGSQETAQDAEVLAPDEAALAQVNRGLTKRPTFKNQLIMGTGIGGVPIRPCYLDFAYSVSPWNDGKFSDGSFVIDKEVEIGKAGGPGPLTVILVQHSKYLAECRYGSDGAKSGALNKYDSAKEADLAGEIVARDDVTTDCENTLKATRADPSLKGTVSVAYDLLMFVRQPEGLNSEKFAFMLNGHRYAYVKLSLVKGMARDMKRDLVNLCAWEAGVRNVPSGKGECNRYMLDMALGKTKQQKNGKTVTYTNLSLRYHKGADGAPEPVPGKCIEDILSLAASGEDVPDAAEDIDCPL